MGFPVIMGRTELEFDTLPALKTVCFHHGGSQDAHDAARIYTMARLYIFKRALHISMCAFERNPPADSRILFAFTGGSAASTAIVLVSPKNVSAALAQSGAPPPLRGPFPGAGALPSAFFSGADEQGWYWGTQFAVTNGIAAKAGCRFEEGEHFCGALFKFREGLDAYGASAEIKDGIPPLSPCGFSAFTVGNAK